MSDLKNMTAAEASVDRTELAIYESACHVAQGLFNDAIREFVDRPENKAAIVAIVNDRISALIPSLSAALLKPNSN